MFKPHFKDSIQKAIEEVIKNKGSEICIRVTQERSIPSYIKSEVEKKVDDAGFTIEDYYEANDDYRDDFSEVAEEVMKSHDIYLVRYEGNTLEVSLDEETANTLARGLAEDMGCFRFDPSDKAVKHVEVVKTNLSDVDAWRWYRFKTVAIY